MLRLQKRKLLAPCALWCSFSSSTHLFVSRYGPRQSKNTAYSEMGRLNVEVKFTPFSCVRRRAPMRVSAMHIARDLTPTILSAVGRRGQVHRRRHPPGSRFLRPVRVASQVNHRYIHHHHRVRRVGRLRRLRIGCSKYGSS